MFIKKFFFYFIPKCFVIFKRNCIIFFLGRIQSTLDSVSKIQLWNLSCLITQFGIWLLFQLSFNVKPKPLNYFFYKWIHNFHVFFYVGMIVRIFLWFTIDWHKHNLYTSFHSFLFHKFYCIQIVVCINSIKIFIRIGIPIDMFSLL